MKFSIMIDEYKQWSKDTVKILIFEKMATSQTKKIYNSKFWEPITLSSYKYVHISQTICRIHLKFSENILKYMYMRKFHFLKITSGYNPIIYFNKWAAQITKLY